MGRNDLLIRNIIKDYCLNEGFSICEACDGVSAIEMVKNNSDIDIIVLDIMMPNMDGYTAYKEIKNISSIPTIILSARSEEYDKLMGFDLGIDDYLTKPFSPRELIARIKAILKRDNKVMESYIYKDLKIDIKAHSVYIKNKEIELRSKYSTKLFCNNKVIIEKEDVDKVIYNRYGVLNDYSNSFKEFDIDKDIVNILEKYDYIKNTKCINILLVSKNVMNITLLVDKIAKNIYKCNYVVIDINEIKELKFDLFESIRINPFSIIFIKNIDKCNKRVLKIIMDSIDKGMIGDINISKCIIFMSISSISSNIGFDDKAICKEGFNNFTKIVNYN